MSTRDDPSVAPADGLAVGVRLRVYPGTEKETGGVIVGDFNDKAGEAVDVGSHHIVDAARRWAVTLDSRDTTTMSQLTIDGHRPVSCPGTPISTTPAAP